VSKTIDRGALAIMLGLSAAVLSGCDQPRGDWRVCQDSQGKRAADGACNTGGGYVGGAHWLYIRGGSAPAVGESISGGESAPSTGVNYGAAPAEGVARGGFGASGEGHGGGDGGAGE
jgi:hypothetical protein